MEARAGIEQIAIQAAAEGDPRVSRRGIRRELRYLANQAGKVLKGASQASERRRRFNKYLFGQGGFAAENDLTSADGVLLHRALERRRGTCVGLAQVYLILAERLGLPVVAAATPTHLFARWPQDGGHVNVELLEGGAEISDAEYRERHRIREADPSNPVFLRDLGQREVAARIYNNRGVIRSLAGDLDGARADYERAIDLDPRFPAPRYNRGLDLLNAGRAEEALADFDAALAIYPADAWALNNRGLARLRLGRSAEAIEDFERALALESDLPAARKNLDLVRARLLQGAPAAIPRPSPTDPPAPDATEPAGPRP